MEIGTNTPEVIAKKVLGLSVDGQWMDAYDTPDHMRCPVNVYDISTVGAMLNLLIDNGHGALKLVCPQAYFVETPVDDEKSEQSPIAP